MNDALASLTTDFIAEALSLSTNSSDGGVTAAPGVLGGAPATETTFDPAA